MNLLQIDPKPAELKPAAPRPMQMGMNQPSGGEDCEKKMFVGGILAGTTVEHVRDYFIHTYGVTVIEVEFKHDKATQRMRGRSLFLSPLNLWKPLRRGLCKED
jgi:hypothetical protein